MRNFVQLRRGLVTAGVLLLAVYAVGRGPFGEEGPPSSRSTTARPVPPAPEPREGSEPPAANRPRVPPGSGKPSGSEPRASGAAAEPPAVRQSAIDLVAWLQQNPLSPHPHQVIRAWGGQPGAVGPVGLYVVVDRSLPTSRLEGLARDLRTAYTDADVFALQVFDSAEAATYDRHIDGGALADRHLVARVVRDEALGTDTIQIRGVPIEP